MNPMLRSTSARLGTGFALAVLGPLAALLPAMHAATAQAPGSPTMAGETGTAESGGTTTPELVCPKPASSGTPGATDRGVDTVGQSGCPEPGFDVQEAPRPGIPGGEERLNRLKRQGAGEPDDRQR